MSDNYTTLTIQRPLTVSAVDIDLPDEEWSNSYTTLAIQRPLTVRTVDIDIPNEKWSKVSCNFSHDKDFTFLAAHGYGACTGIYLKPHRIYSSREWETIFDFGYGSLDFDGDRIVKIRTEATLS
jgi:hypothetical protein